MSTLRSVRLLALLVAACSSAAPASAPATTSPATAPPPSATSPSPTGTHLPNGLANRPYLPALINGEADPCLPLCAEGLADAGPFEVGVRYQTKWFFGGYMTVTPARPWDGGEDSTGELGLRPPGEDEYAIKFAMDLYPVTNRVRVTGVPNTADGLVAWLRDHPHYDISAEIETTIGSLPATAIDVWNSPDAPSQYEDCLGEPCSDMFGFEQFCDCPGRSCLGCQAHINGGILGDDVYRFYFADVEFNGSRHVFSAAVEGRDQPHLDSLIPAVEELLATVTVPAHAAGAPLADASAP